MRIPITINQNTFKTYQIDGSLVKKLPNRLKSADFSWDQNIPKQLQELCIEAIAGNWKDKPLLNEIPFAIDRYQLLNILSSDIPLSLTVSLINDDVYWKKCYIKRWPKALPIDMPKIDMFDIVKESSKRSSLDRINGSVTSVIIQSINHTTITMNPYSKTWKEYFMEMHITEYLENLKPEDYDAEKIKELCDLCGKYIKNLNIKQLQCSKDSPARIPLNAVIASFQNLTELTICFKQININRSFSWDILKLQHQDILLLAKALERLQLKVFGITNTDLDGEKCISLLKALIKHEKLDVLNFSHCKISNRGLIGLAKFTLLNPVKTLNLTNNYIGPRGIEALCYAISKPSCNLMDLDLRLNNIKPQGGNHIIKALTKGTKKLKTLCLSACGLNAENNGLGDMIENNSFLETINLSNNKLGKEIGFKILSGIMYNVTITNLDLRMCDIDPFTEIKIFQKVQKNKSKAFKYYITPIIREPEVSFKITNELLKEIEQVFN